MVASSKGVIVDASVLIKFLVKESQDEEALAEMKKDLKQGQMHFEAPFLLHWELGNFLGRVFEPELASQQMSHINLLKIRSHALNIEITSLAFELMQKIAGVSFYDASYHALALKKGLTFFTCDRKYHEKAKQFGNIALLKDYKGTT